MKYLQSRRKSHHSFSEADTLDLLKIVLPPGIPGALGLLCIAFIDSENDKKFAKLDSENDKKFAKLESVNDKKTEDLEKLFLDGQAASKVEMNCFWTPKQLRRGI